MNAGQIAYGVPLILLLLGMAVFVSWRQWRVVRRLRSQDGGMDREERVYLHQQTVCRLIGSVLMVVLAGLLAGHFAFERPINDLVARGEATRAQGAAPSMTPEEKQLFSSYRNYWLITGLVLLALIVVAAFDYFAIRRYALRSYRRIQEERRTMIADELSRLRTERRERNGHA